MPALTSQLLFAHYVSVHLWMCITQAVYTVTRWVGFTFLMRTKRKIGKKTRITVLFLSKKFKVTDGVCNKRLQNHLMQQMFDIICILKKEDHDYLIFSILDFYGSLLLCF